jgi:HSP20 family molecular chaperone IbpA
MWAEACALVEQAERRHRHFFELLARPSAVPVWEPPVNCFAAGSDLQVTIALPGARPQDVEVRITPQGLEIETTVPPPPVDAPMSVVRLEIPYGRMLRRIDLPAGHYSLLENRLEAGLLTLRLRGLT